MTDTPHAASPIPGKNRGAKADRKKVFVSYARGDGESFAQDLRRKLIAIFGAESVWRDRDEMEGGVGWWAQITEALENVEFMVLVATPAAMASPVVRKEWRYARQQGVCVYPVQVPGLPIDFAALPRWMRDSHFYNLDAEWDTFIGFLKAPCLAPRVPFMAPDLPEHFVQRPAQFDALKSRLLDADFDNPVAITTALKGAGGFGKTTLAAALCHDEDVQAAFDDGVMWVTLGEGPDVVNALTILYRALTDENPGFVNAEEAAVKLAEKLADRDVLLVIDDAWDSAHLRPFLRGGERCARLITTRDAGIAVNARAAMTDVDEMSGGEAVKLLSAGLDGLDPHRLSKIAARLGEWPLLLEIANGQLREHVEIAGDSLSRALDWLERLLDKRGITGVHRDDAETRKRDAAGVLGGTLDLLTPADRARLCQLAAFKDDADVPLSSIGLLWDMDEFDTEDLILKLAKRSLLRFSSSTGTIRLHDVIREYLATQIADMAALHNHLIDLWGFSSPLQSGEGLGVRSDSYAWRNIAYHLTAAGRADTLRALLLNPDFLQAKLNATDPNALIADCETFSDDKTIRLLKSALSMSSHVLIEDKTALPHQLVGRLMSHRKTNTEIRALTDALLYFPGIHTLNPDDEYSILNQAGGALLRTLAGHTDHVNGAIQLAKGRLLSWSADGTLRLWDADGTPFAVLGGHTGRVNGAMQLADGRLLSWSDDNTLRLWDTDGTPLKVMEGHTNKVNGAMQLADGRLLSWSDDSTLRLWDADGTPLAVLEGHTGRMSGAMQLSDGRLLSWAGGFESSDHTLRLWEADGSPITTLVGHTGRVNGAMQLQASAPDAIARLLSWSSDGTLRLWEADGTPIIALSGHTGSVRNAMALSDERLLSWSSDGTLRLWEADGTPITALSGHTDSVRGAVALSGGRLLSWAGRFDISDNTLRLWEADGTPITALSGHTDRVNGVMALSDGRLLSWANDGTLRLWEADSSPITALVGHTGRVNGAIQLADGRLLSWSSDGTLRLWDADGTPINALSGHTSGVSDVIQLSDGRLLSWAGGLISSDNTLRLWKADGSPITALRGHRWSANGAMQLQASAPDAMVRLLSWSSDSTLRLWEADGTPITALSGHTESVNGAVALADGRLLSWSSDSTLRLWEADGTPITTLSGHTGWVNGAIQLSDGRLLSWAGGFNSIDNTLRLWEADGSPITTLRDHRGSVNGVAELADGRLLSWMTHGTLWLWEADGTPITALSGHTESVNGAVALADGRLLSWSSDSTLRLWEADGTPITTLSGHTGWVNGAIQLADGRLLSWSSSKIPLSWMSDGTLRLWKADGTPLDVLDEDYYSGNLEQVYAWAQKHGFNADVLYGSDESVMGDDYRVLDRGHHLQLYRRSDGVTVATFHADAQITCVITIPEQRLIVAGDRVGRVMFLRWVGEK